MESLFETINELGYHQPIENVDEMNSSSKLLMALLTKLSEQMIQYHRLYSINDMNTKLEKSKEIISLTEIENKINQIHVTNSQLRLIMSNKFAIITEVQHSLTSNYFALNPPHQNVLFDIITTISNHLTSFELDLEYSSTKCTQIDVKLGNVLDRLTTFLVEVHQYFDALIQLHQTIIQMGIIDNRNIKFDQARTHDLV